MTEHCPTCGGVVRVVGSDDLSGIGMQETPGE